MLSNFVKEVIDILLPSLLKGDLRGPVMWTAELRARRRRAQCSVRPACHTPWPAVDLLRLALQAWQLLKGLGLCGLQQHHVGNGESTPLTRYTNYPS